jgi:hypothetical protein
MGSMGSTAGDDVFLPVQRGAGARVALALLLGGVTTAAVLFVGALFLLPARVSYEVTANEVVVRLKLAGTNRERRYSRESIEHVRFVDLAGGRRVAGTGMPGYCEGRFRYPHLGDVWQATTCGREAVLIRLKGQPRPIVLAPRDREAFRDAIGGRKASTFEPMTGPEAPAWLVVTTRVLPVVLLIPALAVPLMFLVAPRRLRYRVGNGRLVIELLWRRKIVELADAKVTRRPAGRMSRRVGSAMPGYYAGWFSLEGERVNVYASSLEDGVLVTEASGKRTYVSPADATSFLDALSRNGVRTS